ncbi:FeoA family protein [Thermocrinis albus DSM 14484]|uniref:FeoA family protein n=1 Tax=Thermocrinis albus (strain DSM 14484 / JCM 11386 / HI 11/12) TaxID=638303 RepID=D3SNX6_THEAH|nr:FeoA family protein [Thermocrinis albus]ADC88863.1 FeoA family protein [Thermocrinis albus DSM 14484]
MRLEDIPVGAIVRVEGFDGEDAVIRKLEAMGLRKGKEVRILQRVGRVILLRLGNSRLVLSRDVASKVRVA